MGSRFDRCCTVFWCTVVGAWITAGCTPQMRAVPGPEQVLLRGGRTILQTSELAEGAATPVQVPWADENGPVAFRVELTNLSSRDLALDVDRVSLRDSFERLRKPIAPETLVQSFGMEPREPRATFTTASHRAYSFRYRCRSHRPFIYSYDQDPWFRFRRCYGYRWWGYPCYPTPGWDRGLYYSYTPSPGLGHDEAHDAAAFVSELLESQVVPPNVTVIGNIVFAYGPQKDDELLLSIPTFMAEPGTATRPADAETSDGPVLEFRFEVE